MHRPSLSQMPGQLRDQPRHRFTGQRARLWSNSAPTNRRCAPASMCERTGRCRSAYLLVPRRRDDEMLGRERGRAARGQQHDAALDAGAGPVVHLPLASRAVDPLPHRSRHHEAKAATVVPSSTPFEGTARNGACRSASVSAGTRSRDHGNHRRPLGAPRGVLGGESFGRGRAAAG